MIGGWCTIPRPESGRVRIRPNPVLRRRLTCFVVLSMAGSLLASAEGINSLDSRQYIKDFEGLRLEFYKGPKGWNLIGYGRNVDTVGTPEIGGRTEGTITPAQAEEMFENDYTRSQGTCQYLFPDFLKLSRVRQAALQDMAYSIGHKGLKKFKRLVKAVNSGDFTAAYKEILDSDYGRDPVTMRRAGINAEIILTNMLRTRAGEPTKKHTLLSNANSPLHSPAPFFSEAPSASSSGEPE